MIDDVVDDSLSFPLRHRDTALLPFGVSFNVR
jgi:hypothetical protein